MNKVFLSGMIADDPVLFEMKNGLPHLTMKLSVRHKVKSGEFRREIYRVSAWGEAAQWGMENLVRGQIVAMQGYLTQRSVSVQDFNGIAVEVAVEEFFPMRIPHMQHERYAGADAQEDGDEKEVKEWKKESAS